jgi:hypothetical protein
VSAVRFVPAPPPWYGLWGLPVWFRLLIQHCNQFFGLYWINHLWKFVPLCYFLFQHFGHSATGPLHVGVDIDCLHIVNDRLKINERTLFTSINRHLTILLMQFYLRILDGLRKRLNRFFGL